MWKNFFSRGETHGDGRLPLHGKEETEKAGFEIFLKTMQKNIEFFANPIERRMKI